MGILVSLPVVLGIVVDWVPRSFPRSDLTWLALVVPVAAGILALTVSIRCVADWGI